MTDFLTTPEAAAMLRVSPASLRKLVALNGRTKEPPVPCVKLTSRKWIFPRKRLEGWLERKETQR